MLSWRLTLRHQVAMLAVVLVGLLLAWARVDLRSRAKLDTLLDEQARVVEHKDALAGIEATLLRARLEQEAFLRTHDAERFESFSRGVEQARTRIRDLDHDAADPELRESLERLELALDRQADALGSLEHVPDGAEFDVGIARVGVEAAAVGPQVDAARLHLDTRVAHAAAAVRVEREANTREVMAVFTVGFFFSGGFLLWQIRGGLVFARRVHKLAETMHEVADGNFARVGELPETGDEVGDLAASFRRMAARIEGQILDLETARERAEVASRTKSAFLANMSHELRTPLNAIIGYAELVAEELGDVEEDSPYGDLGDDVERILLSARHLLSLINDILDISKIEAGEMKVELRPVDLRRLLSEVQASVEMLVRQRRNTLVVEIEDEIGSLESDPLKLRQILLNLLGNAAKFTDEGTISVRVAAHENGRGDLADALRFEIRDTGIGISADKLDALFEPFVQADTSTSRRFGGTGLGLAICRHFSELLGGELQASSVPGEGSLFTLILPRNPVLPEASLVGSIADLGVDGD